MFPERLAKCSCKEAYCARRKASEGGRKQWWPRYKSEHPLCDCFLVKIAGKNGRGWGLWLQDEGLGA